MRHLSPVANGPANAAVGVFLSEARAASGMVVSVFNSQLANSFNSHQMRYKFIAERGAKNYKLHKISF